jgi:hypothetical protein
MPRRYGRPGLVGTMARTAVISGTATAVSGSVQRKQAAAQQAQAAQAVPAAPSQPPPAPAPSAPAASVPQDATMVELQRLVELKQQDLLTDEEFAVMKARLLGLAP